MGLLISLGRVLSTVMNPDQGGSHPHIPYPSIDCLEEPRQLPSTTNQPSGDNSDMTNGQTVFLPCEHQSISPMEPAKRLDTPGDIERFKTHTQELVGKALLENKDRETVKKFASLVCSAAAMYPSTLAQCPKVLEGIAAALITGREERDCDLLQSTVGTFVSISRLDAHHDGLEAIMSNGAIPHLVGLLSQDFEPTITYYTVCVLRNLLFYHPNATVAIRPATVVPLFVRILERESHEKSEATVSEIIRIQVVAIESLRILARMNADTELLVIESNAQVHSIRILNSANDEELLWVASRLIAALCNTIRRTKRIIIRAGGMQALTKHLSDEPSNRLVLSCLLALRNISDSAVFAKDVNCLLERLIQYLASCSDRKVIDYCLCILYNLTCKNSRNKQHVCEQLGVESLMRVLLEHWHDQEITGNALATLRNLLFRSKMDTQIWRRKMAIETSRDKLRQMGCLPLICRYLESPHQFLQHPEVILEALFLLRYLAMGGGASWDEFRLYRIVEATARLVCHVYSQLNALVNQLGQHTKCKWVMNRAFMALSVMCQCEENRRILLDDVEIRNIANEVINNPGFSVVRKSASEFLAALSAPFRAVAQQ